MLVEREPGREGAGGAAIYCWRFIVSALLFLLLWEWVRPLVELSHLTDLHIVEPLLIAIGSFIVIDFLRCSAWLGWSLKVLVSLAIVGYFFHGQFIGELAWLLRYKNIVMLDLSNVLQGDFALSAENRTIILLVGIAFLTSVIQSLLLGWQTGGYFVVATFIYLLSLQWWAGVDTTAGIVRAFVFGIALLMILNMAKVQRIFDVNFTMHSSMRRWVMAGLLVLLLTVGAGGVAIFFADEEAPLSVWEAESGSDLATNHMWLTNFKWGEHIRSFALERQSGSLPQSTRHAQAAFGSSGYGGSDHRLGGQVQLNDGIVFIAPLDKPAYWRGESKIYYDGKGWADDKYLARSAAYYDRIKSPQSAYFLQLPERLPERVKQLSSTIVAGEDDVLQQVIMIEHYLKASYTYNIEDVELSHEHLDFVDHFLFEQQFGYCDHFSTAMVVMLRTLGIPARWVKGFSIGDMMDVSYDELRQIIPDEDKHGKPIWLEKVDVPQRTEVAHVGAESVVVRNLHAHSWIEAYIPSLGWLAFEPTPGFEGGVGDSDRAHALLDSIEAVAIEAGATDSRVAGVWSAVSSVMKKGMDVMSLTVPNGLVFVSVLAVTISMVVITILFVILKPRIALWLAIRQSRHSNNGGQAVAHLFDVLWVGVFKRFGPIEPSQTIREYVRVAQVRKASQREALYHFAELYEAIRYDEHQIERLTKNKIIEAWKKI